MQNRPPEWLQRQLATLEGIDRAANPEPRKRETLLVKRLRMAGLTHQQVDAVEEILGDICMYCRDHEEPCYCMRDD